MRVKRTTIYLRAAQKQQLDEIAARTRRTELDLISEGVDRVIRSHRQTPRRKPQALFALCDPMLDNPERLEEALEGFGSPA
jgi:hypothetical protein